MFKQPHAWQTAQSFDGLQEIQQERERLQADQLPESDSLQASTAKQEVAEAPILVVAQEVSTSHFPTHVWKAVSVLCCLASICCLHVLMYLYSIQHVYVPFQTGRCNTTAYHICICKGMCQQ